VISINVLSYELVSQCFYFILGALELKLHCAQAVAGIFAGMGLLWQTALGTFDLCFCEQNATRTEPCYCTASCVLLAPMFTAYEQIGPAGGKVDISAKP